MWNLAHDCWVSVLATAPPRISFFPYAWLFSLIHWYIFPFMCAWLFSLIHLSFHVCIIFIDNSFLSCMLGCFHWYIFLFMYTWLLSLIYLSFYVRLIVFIATYFLSCLHCCFGSKIKFFCLCLLFVHTIFHSCILLSFYWLHFFPHWFIFSFIDILSFDGYMFS